MIRSRDDLPPVPRAAWDLFLEHAVLDDLHEFDERRFARFVVVSRDEAIDFAGLLSEHVGYSIESSDSTPDHRPLARLLQTLHEFGRMILSVE